MKVTTDACIQGAWTAMLSHVKRVLDVGAGTGLLALMLAQRNKDILIDGIEFDKDAAAQAADNIQASGWGSRVKILEGDVCNYSFTHKYDLIISNPPFFNNSLLSDKENKNMARHTLSLTYTDLLNVLENNLNEDGYASILLPYTEYLQWQELLLQNGWFEHSKLSVSHNAGAAIKRVVGLFGRNKLAGLNENTLIIRDDENNYTQDFIDLLAPFYLNL